MKRVLILSPHFPPVNGADMHRVRVSAPHFEEFGWHPIVLGVDPGYVSAPIEPLLVDRVENTLDVRRTAAIPERVSGAFGIRDLALRAYPFLLAAGLSEIRRHGVDLVYVSTTLFHAVSMAMLWKRLRGIPFVVDMQDPWAPAAGSGAAGPAGRKLRLARAVHRRVEALTMPHADGLVAVSRDYIDELVRRYPALRCKPRMVQPFGFCTADYETLERNPRENDLFDADDGLFHGVYAGRGGPDMARSLRIVFRALRAGLVRRPDLFSRVRLHFVGTDYAPATRARPRVRPIAESYGVGGLVLERPGRISYFGALQLLRDSRFLLVPGSDDARYTPSKIFAYLLARRPLLAVLHAQSSAVGILESCRPGEVVTFGGGSSDESVADALGSRWTRMLDSPPRAPELSLEALRDYSPRASARRQCRLFDRACEQFASRRAAQFGPT